MLTPTVTFPSKTFKDLKKIELVPPANAGSYWRGIPLYDFASTFTAEADKSSLKRIKWDHGVQIATSLDNADIVMSVAFEWPKDIATLPSEMKKLQLVPCLGAMASNAQRFAMRFYAGVYSETYEAGMVFGEVETPHKRHTEGADLSLIFMEVLDNFTVHLPLYKTILAKLRATRLKSKHADHLTVQIGREKILPWSRAGKFDAELRDFGEDGQNALNASVAFGRAACIEPVFRQFPEMLQFHHLLDEVAAVSGAPVGAS